MEESGADALRFALIHGATPGLDQKFGPQKLEIGRTFANKLWNATRYVLGARPGSIAADAVREDPDPARLGASERWIRSRTSAAVSGVDQAIADHQLAEVTRTLLDGIWSEFCDWGLELAKVRLSDSTLSDAEHGATWWTLVESLDRFLRLLHPVMPFVTEVLWAALPHRSDESPLLITARWPDPGLRDEALESDVAEVLDLIRAIRNARAEAGVDAAAWLPGVAIVPEGTDLAVARPELDTLMGVFDALRPAIGRLARIRPLTVAAGGGATDAPIESPLPVLSGRLQVILELSGDGSTASTAQDRGRLERELVDAGALLDAARARLENPQFVERAPAAIVDGARARAAELEDLVARLRESVRR
jgi:valyl-tRNA synthetase